MKKTLVPFISVVVCLLFLFACAPKHVENKSIDVLLDGVSTKCLYTGAYMFKPSGVGEYKFTTEDEEWVFTGEPSDKSELTNGSVEDMPYSFKRDGEKYETLYTGEVENLLPTEALTIKDYPFTLEFNGEKLEGLYSGSLVDEMPDGQGKFSHEDKGDYFEYTGGWKAGALSGNGDVESNCFVIHFPEVDREGEYKGALVNGLPSGQGTFNAINSENISYEYVGAWKNGLFDGEGHQEYDTDDYWVLDGNFSNGDFEPTVADFYVTLGTMKTSKYSISKSEYDYISSHENLFTGRTQKVDDSVIDVSFKYEEFSKNPSAFELSLIKVGGLRVVQVFEYENFGYKYVFVLANDSKYRMYYINMIGSAPSILEGSRIQVVALPVDFFTYESVSGTDIWAISCIGITITKQ